MTNYEDSFTRRTQPYRKQAGIGDYVQHLDSLSPQGLAHERQKLISELAAGQGAADHQHLLDHIDQTLQEYGPEEWDVRDQ